MTWNEWTSGGHVEIGFGNKSDRRIILSAIDRESIDSQIKFTAAQTKKKGYFICRKEFIAVSKSISETGWKKLKINNEKKSNKREKSNIMDT